MKHRVLLMLTVAALLAPGGRWCFAGQGGSTNDTQEDVVFVFGAVMRPDTYPWEKDLRILKAIALAGGLRPHARSQKTVVIRDRKLIRLDLSAIARGKERPFLLRPFDVVVMGEASNRVFRTRGHQWHLRASVPRVEARARSAAADSGPSEQSRATGSAQEK